MAQLPVRGPTLGDTACPVGEFDTRSRFLLVDRRPAAARPGDIHNFEVAGPSRAGSEKVDHHTTRPRVRNLRSATGPADAAGQ